MANDRVSPEELRAMLQEVSELIERGGNMQSLTIKAMVDDSEIEHTFSLRTEEERLAALVAIKTLLGQVH
jgi:hypothetical protein